jgi:hypothetical protein
MADTKKYKALRSFFWKVKNGKRTNVKKGEVLELSEDEYKEIGAFGLVPVKEEEKKKDK